MSRFCWRQTVKVNSIDPMRVLCARTWNNTRDDDAFVRVCVITREFMANRWPDSSRLLEIYVHTRAPALAYDTYDGRIQG